MQIRRGFFLFVFLTIFGILCLIQDGRCYETQTQGSNFSLNFLASRSTESVNESVFDLIFESF